MLSLLSQSFRPNTKTGSRAETEWLWNVSEAALSAGGEGLFFLVKAGLSHV